MANFGVTTEMVEALSHGMKFDSTNYPTTTHIERWINAEDARVSAKMWRKGVDASGLSATDGGYLIGQDWVSRLVGARAMRARTHLMEQANTIKKEVEQEIKDFVKAPSDLGENQNTNSGAPNVNMSHISEEDEIEDHRDTLPTGERYFAAALDDHRW